MSEYIDINGVGWALIPKNASIYLREKQHKEISFNEFMKLEKRCAYIREPMERFYSAFQFFNMLSSIGTNYKDSELGIADTYEKFVDYALLNEDEHWACQSDFLIRDGELITNSNTLLKKTKSKHMNSSKPLSFNKLYRFRDLQNYYSRDYRLLGHILWR